MATKSRIKRKAAKRPTSTKEAEEGIVAAQDVFRRFLEKADPAASSTVSEKARKR